LIFILFFIYYVLKVQHMMVIEIVFYTGFDFDIGSGIDLYVLKYILKKSFDYME